MARWFALADIINWVKETTFFYNYSYSSYDNSSAIRHTLRPISPEGYVESWFEDYWNTADCNAFLWAKDNKNNVSLIEHISNYDSAADGATDTMTAMEKLRSFVQRINDGEAEQLEIAIAGDDYHNYAYGRKTL